MTEIIIARERALWRKVMKKITLFSLPLLYAFVLLVTTPLTGQTPKGWFPSGSNPKDYKMGTVTGVPCEGQKCGHMKSIFSVIDGFGTYMQTISSEKYLGKRVRMTARMKTKNVQTWACMWMQVVDPKRSDKNLAYDNMENRQLKGTIDWTLCEIVLDVAEGSGAVAFGFILEGTGEIWFDSVKFEIVDKSVPVTDMMAGSPSGLPPEPSNLDFEE